MCTLLSFYWLVQHMMYVPLVPLTRLLHAQKRDVSVYRLIAAGTMEELIYQRQTYKQQQTAVATEGVHERRYFEGVP